MDRRSALAAIQKTTDTTEAAGGLLEPSQSARFIRRMGEAIEFSNKIRIERRRSATGELNKLYGNNRLLRAATENSDDGYRAGFNFPTVPYTAQKVRLPWEVTEDVFHENIEGESIESDLTSQMEETFGEDLEDLDWNGDTTAVGADADFLNINDGVLKQLVDNAGSTHRLDATTINGGVLEKGHLFAAKRLLPTRYRRDPNLVWACSPDKIDEWTEYLTDRATSAGDSALIAQGDPVERPLRIPFVAIPSLPTDRIVLINPKNVVRVITWDVRRRRVTGETDAQLAATDKRFYVFFIKHDTIVEEFDAVVDIYDLS